jgi:predicted RND superfamily exporter protein
VTFEKELDFDRSRIQTDMVEGSKDPEVEKTLNDLEQSFKGADQLNDMFEGSTRKKYGRRSRAAVITDIKDLEDQPE